MKTAFLSDIHGNLWAFRAVLEDIARRDVPQIVNLGDSLYGPLDPAGTADLLMKLAIPGVRGNQDRQLVSEIAPANTPSWPFTRKALSSAHLQWLEELPPLAEFGADLFLCHGTPEDDDTYLLEDASTGRIRSEDVLLSMVAGVSRKIVVCGHSHISRTVQLGDGRMILNPGSVGLPAYVGDPPAHVMESGSPHARYLILEGEPGAWTVQQVAVPYDWRKAAQTAARNGRPDWVPWLLTGRALVAA
jgi:putative phosphoesterase